MSTVPSPTLGPDLRSALIAMVRKRVPESEVEDIVQTALAEAIESPNAPKEPEALRRWIFGVAKNKVVDYHRRAGRETPKGEDLPDVPEAPAPHVEADLLRWAERNLPEGDDAKKTLDWMLREGEGEKLESIALSEHVPAPRVRQRVSRLRRHFKDHWQKEVALLATLGVLVGVIFFYLRSQKPDDIAHDPNVLPADPRAEGIRKAALEKCAALEWRDCVQGLDEAKRLDPAGDSRPEVKNARAAADKAINNVTPPPSAVPSAVPTSSNDIPPLDPNESQTKDGNFRGKAQKPSPPSSAFPTALPTAKPPAKSIDGKKSSVTPAKPMGTENFDFKSSTPPPPQMTKEKKEDFEPKNAPTKGGGGKSGGAKGGGSLGAKGNAKAPDPSWDSMSGSTPQPAKK